jgi:hypothetical protein
MDKNKISLNYSKKNLNNNQIGRFSNNINLDDSKNEKDLFKEIELKYNYNPTKSY